jgi:hypothetical protein
VIFNKILYSLVSRNVLVSVPIHSSFVNFRLKMREYCSIANDAKTHRIFNVKRRKKDQDFRQLCHKRRPAETGSRLPPL